MLEGDVKAIAAYIAAVIKPATVSRPEDGGQPATGAQTQSMARAPGSHTGDVAAGQMIYAGACALCHEPTGQRFSARGINLGSSKVISMPDPRNFAHVILHGIRPPLASPAAGMPGFGDALTESQVVSLMAYLRSTFSGRPAWTGLEDRVREVRDSREGS